MAKDSFKYKVSPGSTAGRLGEGLGKGLAESIPKEVNQYRLSQGLQNFAKNAGNLSPLEAATQLFSIPGVTPQMVQSLPELLKQQQLGQSLNQQQVPPEFPTLPDEMNRQPSSGLTTREGIEAQRKGYIRPTPQQIDARAAELYKSNPARFKSNPELAIQYAQNEAANEQAINQDLQQRRAGEKGLQRDVESTLQNQSTLLNAKVPGDVFSKIREKAVKSILPENEGGEGLTDEEAKLKYGNELDEASRQYNALDAVGDWTLPVQKPSEILRNLKSIREQFKSRDDLRNFADSLTAKNGLSPSKSYLLTYPTSDLPELNKTIGKLPDVNPKTSVKKGFLETKESDYNPDAILKQMMPKLLKDMSNTGSPLSVAEELQSKGYNPDIWLDYLNDNRSKLTGEQADQLNKPRSWFPNMNDIWLFKFTNQDKFVE